MSEPRFTKDGQHIQFFNGKRDDKEKRYLSEKVYDYADEHNLTIDHINAYTYQGTSYPFAMVVFRRRNMLGCAECSQPTHNDYLCDKCRKEKDEMF